MGQAQPGGRRAFGLIIIAAGVFFLLAQLGIFSFDFVGFLWPLFIIVPGLVFLYFARSGGDDLARLLAGQPGENQAPVARNGCRQVWRQRDVDPIRRSIELLEEVVAVD